MKLKLLFSTLILILFANHFNYAQSSASESGIAIQGIARDASYTARLNESLDLTFEFYYKEGVSKPQIVSINEPVTTDDFGVFSVIVDPGVENNVLFSNHLVYLKISEGGTIISDEKLKHVPYAISANNGVPTGSIMPFIGTNAPAGWVLCDGNPLPVDGSAANLIALMNGMVNAPNLLGMFLRGTGTSPVNSQDGPALMGTQDDALKAHLHDAGGLKNNTTGAHRHGLGRGTAAGSNPGVSSNAGNTLFNPSPIQSAGNHTHIISGSTAETGDLETRPVNYGVNYIIKL